MAERRSAEGVEGLAAEATRTSSRRKWHPLALVACGTTQTPF